MRDMMFPFCCWSRLTSYGVGRHVNWLLVADVSEDLTASMFLNYFKVVSKKRLSQDRQVITICHCFLSQKTLIVLQVHRYSSILVIW
jgi:hypothetical protein